RDVKPQNILVARDAKASEIAKLTDFGLARTYQASQLSGLTLAGNAGGTPGFMAPEQLLDFRSAKPAADQYAAAGTLYFLLTGQPPFGQCHRAADFFQRLLSGSPEPLQKHRRDVPARLAAAIHRALSRRPEDRFGDVTAMKMALAGCI